MSKSSRSKRRANNNKKNNKALVSSTNNDEALLQSLRKESENDISFGRPLHEESQIGIAQRIWMRGNYKVPAHTVLCDCARHREVPRFADCPIRSVACNGTVPFVLLRYVPLICWGKECNNLLRDDEVHFLGHAKMCEGCFVMCVTSINGNSACKFMDFGPVMRTHGCRYCFPDKFKDKDVVFRVTTNPPPSGHQVGLPGNGKSQTYQIPRGTSDFQS